MDFGKEEKDLKQQNNSLTCRPLCGNPGRWRNCDGWDLLFLCSSLASDRFFQVLLPNSGTCLLGVLWLLPGGKSTIRQSAEGSWNDDYLKYSLAVTQGQVIVCTEDRDKRREGVSSFLTSSWHIQAEAPPSLSHVLFCRVFVLQKGTCRRWCFLQIFYFALTK